MRTSKYKGFSLVEVIVAVGIFAFAIVGVLGLLSPTGKSIVDVAENDAASRAISAIQAGIQEYYQAESQVARSNGTDPFVHFSTLVFSRTLFANKAGSKIGADDRKVGNVSYWGSNAEKFFEFTIQRNVALSPAGNNPQTNRPYDEGAGFLAFVITLKWPAYVPDPGNPSGGTRITDDSQKSTLVVPAAITR